MTFHMYLLAAGSIPLDGSSRKITGGLPIKAIATTNFLLFPPEYYPAGMSAYYANPISSSYYWIYLALIDLGIPLITENKCKCSLAVRRWRIGFPCGQ